MIKIKEKTSTYIFNAIAIITLAGSFYIYTLFEKISSDIEINNLESNTQYIDNITSNISDSITSLIKNDNLYLSLKNDDKLRQELEKKLQLFVTNKYRYVYVVDKENINSNDFRFLLDGSKDFYDKAEFLQEYTPLDIEKWNDVYKNKKANFFSHDDIKSVWLSYLKPIIINDKVVAIIAIDFSLQDHKTVVKSLEIIDDSFEIVIGFSLIVFFIILFFSNIDKKRIIQLKQQSLKIQEFNDTLKIKVEKELEKNRLKDQQLVQQSRLAQMGEMISMIAHQWRQPLAAISSTSNAINLKAKLNSLDKQTTIDLSDKITSYSKHLSSTIDDFREFFKSNKEKRETSYDDLINSVLSIVETSITNKNITLIKNLQSKDKFNTYPNEIKQVILNLIKNAEDILLEKQIQDAHIIIKSFDNKLQIIDNAGGIPSDIIDKIFDPYFSTKTKKDGTGLGLYMSKTIIEEHCNGQLSVINKNDGAVFTIELENTNG